MNQPTRHDVISPKRHGWLSALQRAVSLPYRVLAALSFSACFGVMVFYCGPGWSNNHEEASGELVPTQPLFSAQAPSSGTIARVWVHEGSIVVRDQPLMDISVEPDKLKQDSADASIRDELAAQRIRSVATLKDQTQLTAQKREGLRSRIAIFDRQLQQIDTQLVIQSEQAKSAHELWQRLQPFAARGVVSAVQIEQQKSVALSAQSEYAALRRQRADIEQQIDVQQDQLRQLPLVAEAERRELQYRLVEIDHALAKSENPKVIVLRAPQAGIVSSVLIKDGQSVAAGQSLLGVIPDGAEWQAQLWVSKRVILSVTLGDHVILHNQNSANHEMEQYEGEIIGISRIEPDTSRHARSAYNTNEPDSLVVVRLNTHPLVGNGSTDVIKRGLMVDADISLRRHLIDWPLAPSSG